MRYNPHLGEIEKVFEDHEKLIHYIIQRHFKAVVGRKVAEHDDLFQEGSLGLIKAYERFDPTKGVFASILYTYVLGQMRLFVRDKAETMRFPRNGGKQKKFVPGNVIVGDYSEELFNTIPSYSDFSNVIVEDFYTKLTTRERTVMIGKLEKRPEKEIGGRMGYSQAYIGKLFKTKVIPKAVEHFQLEVAQ